MFHLQKMSTYCIWRESERKRERDAYYKSRRQNGYKPIYLLGSNIIKKSIQNPFLGGPPTSNFFPIPLLLCYSYIKF